MRAFVAGATGETGRRIVKELVGRGIPVRALVRSRELAAQVLPPEAEVVVGDVLDPATLRAGMEGCTVVLCATGARPSWDPLQPYRVDYEGTKNLVNVAKAQGIQHFVLISSLCVSQLFHPLNLFWLILVWKKRAEEYLQKSGLTYTIIRPGGLKNQDNEDGIVLSQADTLFEGSIPRLKVAQVAVESLFQPAAKNRIFEIIAKPGVPRREWSDLFALA
ncbi:SDR family oxidoreductase, partial [Synechococcus sp. H55.11]|uniref:SDR family oxidoreductase n=2 Tax=unclassified Synechococcus TaxID=2626047 RepID=UPI0039C386C6